MVASSWLMDIGKENSISPADDKLWKRLITEPYPWGKSIIICLVDTAISGGHVLKRAGQRSQYAYRWPNRVVDIGIKVRSFIAAISGRALNLITESRFRVSLGITCQSSCKYQA